MISCQEQEPFSKVLRLAVVPSWLPVQWVMGALRRIKADTIDADHSSPTSAGITNEWSFTSTPVYAFMECTVTFSLSLSLYYT